jgi:hypothetical protein
MFGWAIMLSAVVLSALYRGPTLGWVEWALLFAVCLFAGAILVDLDVVVLSFFGAFLLSVLLDFLSLSLPALLGVLEHAAQREALFQWTAVLVVRTVVPLPLMYCFAVSLVGAFLREHFG